MKITNAASLILLSVFLLLLLGCDVGCDDPPPQTATVKLETSAAAAGKQNCGDIRVEFIAAPEKDSWWSPPKSSEQIHKETRRLMEEFINSGNYEIVAVTTTRSGGEPRYLVSAEIYYRQKK